MRTELKKRDGQRGEFSATFERYGRAKITIPGYGRFRKAPPTKEIITLLFIDVRDSTGAVVTDHLWFHTCKQWTALGLKSGDKVKFEARVKPYEKGYAGDGEFDGGCGRETDFKLAFPTKARLVDAFAGDLSLLSSIACQGCGSAVANGERLCVRCSGRMD